MIPSINGTVRKGEGMCNFPTQQITYFWTAETPWAREEAEVLEKRLRKLERYGHFKIMGVENSADIASDSSVTLRFVFSRQLNKEAYCLRISTDRITIFSGGGEGAAHALTTLYWKIREQSGALACEEINDSPRYEHRGFHLDCSRHFFDVETVKSMIEQGALRKLNRLHWHLSDDQGYRIESRRFPALNSIGSWRKETDEETYGGYYTWKEIQEIVSYAKARGVEIIPEIDLPGHVSAMIAAYPELSCSGEAMEVPINHGIHERILCVGKEQTISFVKELVTEVCELFPYPYFHIGGDEVPKQEWKKCSHCQDRMRKLGLRDEEALQAWFTQEIMAFLREKGKIGIAWNETLKSGLLSDDVVIQYWAEEGADAGYCENAFAKGRKCVYSFSSYLYFDFMHALTPLRKVYGIKEIVSCGNPIPEKNILGWEGTLWSEQIPDRKCLEQKAFPRLLAVAERTWNGKESYESFLENCRRDVDFLHQDNINATSVDEADPYGEKQIRSIVEEWRPLAQAVKNSDQYRDVVNEILCTKLEGNFEGDELEDVKRRLFD